MKNEYDNAGEFLETAIDFINFLIDRIEKTKKTKFSVGLVNSGILVEVIPGENIIEKRPKVLGLAAGITARMLNYYHAGSGVSLGWSGNNDIFLFSVDHNSGTEESEFVSTENLSYSVQKSKINE